MALPATLALDLPTTPFFIGPFISSTGKVFVFLLDSANNQIKAYTSTDPENSGFSAGTNVQFSTGSPNSVDMVQVGDRVHMAAMVVDRSGMTPVGYVYYDSIDLDPGTSFNGTETLDSGFNPDSTGLQVDGCSIGVRSDGDIIVLYNGPAASIMGTSYARVVWARREGVTWTTRVALDPGLETTYRVGKIVMGSSDRAHVTLSSQLAVLYARTIRSDNSLSTLATIDSTVGASYDVGHGVAYVDGGATKIRFPYADSSAVSLLQFDSADSPNHGVTVGISNSSYYTENRRRVFALAVYGTTVYLLYADNTNKDLWRTDSSDSFTAETELVATTLTSGVSPNVFTRAGSTKLAYVYIDNGTVKYNEHSLTAAATSFLLPPSRVAALLRR